MENASKALIMAAGVLITILVASLWIFVFKQMASGVSNVNKIMESSEITEFNQQFLKYDGRGKKTDSNGNITDFMNIHDVITIVNISKNNDEKEEFPVHVKVVIKNHTEPSVVNKDLTKWSDDGLKNLMLYEVKADNKYSCEVKYSTEDDRFVDEVIINVI